VQVRERFADKTDAVNSYWIWFITVRFGRRKPKLYRVFHDFRA